LPRHRPSYEAKIEVVAATEQALLCDFDGEEHWIPKSLLGDDADIDKSSSVGDTGEISIPEWFAIQEGII